MLNELVVKKSCHVTREIENVNEVEKIVITEDKNYLVYKDGTRCDTSCIRCEESPCMSYTEKEIVPGHISTFPADKNTSVCPTDAITWASNTKAGPTVSSDLCIGCGLCAIRCPVAAITIKDGKATIHDNDTMYIKEKKSEEPIQLPNFVRQGKYVNENDSNILQIYKAIDTKSRTRGNKFPNMLVRNLLIAIGWKTGIRRSGDANMRIDALATKDDIVLITEIEFTNAAIDTPRCILDGYAVLHSRYNIEKKNLSGMVVVKELPNTRSDYWKFIDNVEKCTGVKIHTISVIGLILHVWNNSMLSELPYANDAAPTIRDTLEKNIGRKLNIGNSVCNVCEPAK